MAYTSYPAEAAAFSTEALALSIELQSTKSGLNSSNSVFHINSNEDYLTLKTLEATSKIQGIIDDGVSKLDSDAGKVSAKAAELEEEERQRQEALKAKNNSNDTSTENTSE